MAAPSNPKTSGAVTPGRTWAQPSATALSLTSEITTKQASQRHLSRHPSFARNASATTVQRVTNVFVAPSACERGQPHPDARGIRAAASPMTYRPGRTSPPDGEHQRDST
jgi:hypothetical protein